MEVNIPLVSIIAVNYNSAPWVLDTLNSIAAQTYPNIELIVVDDCSTDKSPQLIEGWLKTCSHSFRYIRHKENKGVCATCNTGFKLATGHFISYTATDDILLPEKTTEQVRLLQESDGETGMVYSDAYMIDDKGGPVYGWFIQKYRQDFQRPPSGWIFENLLRGNFIPAMSVLIRKEVIEEVGYFDENLVYEDYDMWLRIASKYKIAYYEKPCVKYRVREGSLGQSIKNWNPMRIQILLKFRQRTDVQHQLADLATRAYIDKDLESLNLLKNGGIKIPAIQKILFLHKFRLPHYRARRFACRLIR